MPPPIPGAAPPSMGAAPPPMPGTVPSVPAGSAGTENAVLLIQAMIAAANADGTIDQEERNNILERLKSVNLSAEEHSFIFQELLSPASLETIVSRVKSPETARQVYAVSLMAIEVDTQTEQNYMNTLACRLGLDDAAVEEIRRSVEGV